MDFPISLEGSTPATPASPYGLTSDPNDVLVTLRNAPEELAGLPKSGKITFHFCRKSARVEDGKDGSTLDLTLHLCSIENVEADSEVEEDDETDPLDQLFAEAQESEKEEKDGDKEEA